MKMNFAKKATALAMSVLFAISKAICDKLGYELKIEDMSFETILASVNSGKADFGAAGMTVTPEREESVDFTDTYANATQVVIVRK